METQEEQQLIKVLIADDDEHVLDCYRDAFTEDEPTNHMKALDALAAELFDPDTDVVDEPKFEIVSCCQGDDAISLARKASDEGLPFDVVILDVRMPPGIDGIEAAGQIREIDPNVNIVIVTGSGGTEPENLGKEIPPADKIFYFKKPFHAIECRQLAAALCGKWHSDLALRKANEELEMRVAKRTKELHQLAYYDPVTSLPNRCGSSKSSTT